MNRILLKNGIIVDPSQKLHESGDVLVTDGVIARCGGAIAEAESGDIQIIDCREKYIVPGLIDMHVHLREPGFEYKEDIASGTRAAVRGGFTAVACMPNTRPVADNCSVLQYIKTKAQQSALARVYPIGAISKGLAGKEIAEIAELYEAGAVGISDDGNPVSNAEVMRRAMEYARMFNLPVISHAEDRNLSGDGVMHEGYYSLVYGMKGIPAAAEEVMIARDIILAELTGCRLHVCHVSTAGSVQLLREAKARGVQVTAEVTPHHLALTDELLGDYDANFKVNPPLRPREDTAALKQGLTEGILDIIVTDHAPHSSEDKDCEFDYAPCGMIGLETSFAVAYQELVTGGILSLDQLIDKMACAPARIFGLPGGTLAAGAPADVTVLDLQKTEVVTREGFVSKSSNSPFIGRQLQGLPVLTIVGGKIVMRSRAITEE